MATLGDISALLQSIGAPASIVPQLTAIVAGEDAQLNPSIVVSDPAPSDPNAVSVGFWQINSPNFAWLTQLLGTPVNAQTLAASPQLQAKSAVAIATQTPGGLNNWSTWLDYSDVKAGAQGLTASQQSAAARVAAGLNVQPTGIDWGKALNPFDPNYWTQNGGPGGLASPGTQQQTTPSDLQWWQTSDGVLNFFKGLLPPALVTPQALLILGIALGLAVLLFFFSRTGSEEDVNVTVAAPTKASA